MEALGLSEFARVSAAHRVHIFWIVHRLSTAALVGSGATSSIPPMGSRASDSTIQRDFRVVSEE
jgi:hypothetical protein